MREKQSGWHTSCTRWNNMDSPLLVPCSSLCGEAVVDGGDAPLGRLDHMVIDPASGRIAFAVVAAGGVFGIGETLREVPWRALKRDEARGVWVLGDGVQSYGL
jgi:hypothetical protein